MYRNAQWKNNNLHIKRIYQKSTTERGGSEPVFWRWVRRLATNLLLSRRRVKSSFQNNHRQALMRKHTRCHLPLKTNSSTTPSPPLITADNIRGRETVHFFFFCFFMVTLKTILYSYSSSLNTKRSVTYNAFDRYSDFTNYWVNVYCGSTFGPVKKTRKLNLGGIPEISRVQMARRPNCQRPSPRNEWKKRSRDNSWILIILICMYPSDRDTDLQY